MKINVNYSVDKLNQGLGLFEAPKEQQGSFQEILQAAMTNVDQLEKISEDYSVRLASGQLDNIHEATLAASKAEISLNYLIQIRNKVLEAYREITRMQI
ncbi:flagellar hook-basal body complex protein FliE [Alkaliphilus crotonatoxidans]